MEISEVVSQAMHSTIFVSCGLAWLLAQGVKTILYAVKLHEFDWRRALLGTGGMPSSHSAFVTALAGSIFLIEGVSTAFVVALGFGLITLRDAVGVRLAVGNQATVLNALISQNGWEFLPLPSTIGHKPLEVLAGVLTGLLATGATAILG